MSRIFFDVPEVLAALTRQYMQHEAGMQAEQVLKTWIHSYYRRMDVSLHKLFTEPVFLIAKCLCFATRSL